MMKRKMKPLRRLNFRFFSLLILSFCLGCSQLGGTGGSGSPVGPGNNNLPLTWKSMALVAGTANAGAVDGTGDSALFANVSGVVSDSAGNAYVADSDSHAIRKVSTAGAVTTFAGSLGTSGNADGPGTTARLYLPKKIAIDSNGNFYVTESSGSLRKITPEGIVSTLTTSPTFTTPLGIAVDKTGTIFVADATSRLVSKINPNGLAVTLLAGGGGSGGTDGTGAAASLGVIKSMTFDPSGNLIVADWTYNTIRKITMEGVVTTLAGNPGVSGSANGTGSSATFNFPEDIICDAGGNFFVADLGNYLIRKVTADGVVTTTAGISGLSGSLLGDLPGKLVYPRSLAIKSNGELLIGDDYKILRLY